MSNHEAPSQSTSNRELHVVFGSGGTQALLAGTGSVLAFHIAGLTEWTSIGSASAGSIPAAILGSKLPPRDFLPQVLDTDFQGLLKRQTSYFGMVLALLRKYHLEKVRPAKGVFDPAGMRVFIDSIVKTWPDSFWTVASCDHGQVLFTKAGVFKYQHQGPQGHHMAPILDGPATILTSTPPSVGTAVHATCAIPGIIDTAHLHGENLFDGALGSDGAVPVNVIWRHFPGDDKLVLAIDVGEDPMKNNRIMRFLWNVFCGGNCASIDGIRPQARPGLVVINPRIEDFHSLKFDLPRGMKWKAILGGFHATVRTILAHKLTDEAGSERLQKFASVFRCLECKAKKPQDLIKPVETFLRQQKVLA